MAEYTVFINLIMFISCVNVVNAKNAHWTNIKINLWVFEVNIMLPVYTINVKEST